MQHGVIERVYAGKGQITPPVIQVGQMLDSRRDQQSAALTVPTRVEDGVKIIVLDVRQLLR
jgi:hypothetical protein